MVRVIVFLVAFLMTSEGQMLGGVGWFCAFVAEGIAGEVGLRVPCLECILIEKQTRCMR